MTLTPASGASNVANMMRSKIDSLNAEVTKAIGVAESLGGGAHPLLPLPARREAWTQVSLLESQIAELLPPGDLEGEIARHGAVVAAVKAHCFARASELCDRYLAEQLSEPVRGELTKIQNELAEGA